MKTKDMVMELKEFDPESEISLMILVNGIPLPDYLNGVTISADITIIEKFDDDSVSNPVMRIDV